MQLAQLAATGDAAEKALLADVTAKNPDASYIELLRLIRRKKMELATAAKEQDWVEVEVRRPLEAVISSEFGPWRAVRLGLGQWDP